MLFLLDLLSVSFPPIFSLILLKLIFKRHFNICQYIYLTNFSHLIYFVRFLLSVFLTPIASFDFVALFITYLCFIFFYR